MSTLSAIPPAVRSYVHDFDARARRAALWRGAGRALALFLWWMLICCLADRYAQLPPAARLVLLLAGVAAAAAIVSSPLRRAFRRDVDWLAAAALVEAHDPNFGQRLVTVISRLLGPPEHRGSDAMLRTLLLDVDRQAAAAAAAERRARTPVSTSARLIPWLWVAAALLLAGVLTRVPDVNLPRLVQRFAMPLADLPPATTTQVVVLTGDRDVVQSEPLTIRAEVRKLDADGVVSIYLGDAGEGGAASDEWWSRATMAPAAGATGAGGDGRYTFTIAAVDRDRVYYVAAGDATSRRHVVRVLRRPAAAEFRVRYVYPAHTGLPPLTVNNADGVIEAPVGTEATLTVTATEPLRSAKLSVAGASVAMEPAGERQQVGRFVVAKDGPVALELVSTRGVAGSGPETMRVRAIPDLRPLVRLTQPGTGLRLHPRDIVPLPYQALDDYGIESLAVRAQVNGADSDAGRAAVPLTGDVRRQEGVYNFDLAALPLGVGDVVTITLTAKDRAGQTAASEPLQVLVSPRSVDLATYRRIAELSAAADVAENLADQLEAAGAACDEADAVGRDSLGYAAALARGNRQLTAAAESASLLRQSLLRATVQSDAPELAMALAAWVDAAQVMGFAAEDFFRRNAAPDGMGAEARDSLRRARELGGKVEAQVRAVADGQRAAALLADRENWAASRRKVESAQTQPAAARGGPAARERLERLRTTVERARQEIAAGARRLDLDPRAADLDDRLRAKVHAAENVIEAIRPVDFAAEVRTWANRLRRDATGRPAGLDERLSAAAQVEAVRPDADLTRAHDLKQAARAAARLEKQAADPGTAKELFAGEDLDEFVAAVAALERARAAAHKPTTRPTTMPVDASATFAALADARLVLARLAGDSVAAAPPAYVPVGTDGAAPRSEAETLALRAGAASAAKDYEQTRALDRTLRERLLELTHAAAPAPGGAANAAAATPASEAARIDANFRRVGQAVDRAERIDHIAADQDRLAGETPGATTRPTAATAPVLVERQQGVAEAIARAGSVAAAAPQPTTGPWEDPNWRDRATASVVAAQERLAAMPRELAQAQEALVARRELAARAAAARRDEAQAGAAAEQAEQDAAESAERARAALAPLDAAAVESLAGRLRPFAPETEGAAQAIEQLLVPALRDLAKAAEDDNGGEVAAATAADRAADDARRAIEAVQRELARAQQAFVERDPLVAAKWFARAAADSLAQQPPDLNGARRLQRDTSAALSRAWDQSIHEAAAYRLASLPAMRSLYAPWRDPANATDGTLAGGANDEGANGTAPAPGLMSLFGGPAALREWGRLRARPPQEINAAARELDPPGFEEPLRLYFEALGKGESPAPPAAPDGKK